MLGCAPALFGYSQQGRYANTGHWQRLSQQRSHFALSHGLPGSTPLMTYTTEAAYAAGPQAVAVTPAPPQVQAPQVPARAAPVPTAAQSPPPRQHPGFQPPANEAERLEALHSLQILDTEPEARFDDITRIVKAVFKVQFAAITLVDKDRLW